ncbi:hypothetical protein [Wenjunlia tyrosinilytica]|uniref:Uncharacterized protein n=1 Tax=Wenjunlia tyrosinilytica TaxID=1544741 RepID=A0A917ZVV3_9ACTN|nr:hypothetical protein [Wenjunlia tyrosinilytica]GGO98135.1 hypothetical protein GCM10012280_61560 [Wenjunlia tyrosinilytica]
MGKGVEISVKMTVGTSKAIGKATVKTVKFIASEKKARDIRKALDKMHRAQSVYITLVEMTIDGSLSGPGSNRVRIQREEAKGEMLKQMKFLNKNGFDLVHHGNGVIEVRDADGSDE